LFSGFQGKTQPFVSQADGSYAYQGDEGQRKLQIGSSLNVAISDNGKKLFQNITNAARLDAKLTATAGSTLAVSAPLVQDEVAFSGSPAFPSGGIEIQFTAPPGNPKEYTIYDGATPVQTGSMDDDDKRQDSIVFRGVVVHFDGVPAGGENITINADASREKQGVLDTIRQLRTELETNPDSPKGNRDNRDAVAAALTNIDHAMVTIDRTRGDIGARMNMIETTQTDNEDVTLINKTVQAELREVDYPEALSKLAFQSVVLEAAQQSFVKISQLNLFDKIR
jgi:flagellar hook-associated protein 3 FlgL